MMKLFNICDITNLLIGFISVADIASFLRVLLGAGQINRIAVLDIVKGKINDSITQADMSQYLAVMRELYMSLSIVISGKKILEIINEYVFPLGILISVDCNKIESTMICKDCKARRPIRRCVCVSECIDL
jgi:hypothetical protein